MRAGAYRPSRERSGRRRVERTPSTVTMMIKIVPTQTLWTTEESLWTTEAVRHPRPTSEWPKPPTTATLPCVLNKPSKGSTLERGALGHRQALVASLVGRRAFRTRRPLRWSPAAGLCCHASCRRVDRGCSCRGRSAGRGSLLRGRSPGRRKRRGSRAEVRGAHPPALNRQ